LWELLLEIEVADSSLEKLPKHLLCSQSLRSINH
jgi:hypothetical protein